MPDWRLLLITVREVLPRKDMKLPLLPRMAPTVKGLPSSPVVLPLNTEKKKRLGALPRGKKSGENKRLFFAASLSLFDPSSKMRT